MARRSSSFSSASRVCGRARENALQARQIALDETGEIGGAGKDAGQQSGDARVVREAAASAASSGAASACARRLRERRSAAFASLAGERRRRDALA